MPPFELLTPDQIENLIAYTIHLMMRGQVEFAAIRTVLSEDGAPTDLRRFCQQELGRVVSSWQDASKSVVNPATQPVRESGIDAAGSEQDRRIRQGHQLFLLQGGCGSCHKDYGRTDHYLYDFWGIAIRPNNLTLGEYKGGKEPLDLFRRIRGGIPAAGMPATQMSDEQIWDLVAFLQALPVPRKLPEDVRRVIYPQVQ